MLLVIDNHDSFVYNLVQYFGNLGEKITVIRNNKATLEEIEALSPQRIVISPGPGRPEDAGISCGVIRCFTGRVPILGVCLGHQCIGKVFGAKIERSSMPMHGKVSLIKHNGKGLFSDIPQEISVARYHSLVIAKEYPTNELSISAISDDDNVMAVRHQRHPTFGVQFHPESIASQFGKELLQNFLRF